jgi:hypothetical protein
MANRTILDGDSVFVAALDHDGGTIWENTLNQPGMSVRGGGIQTLANGDLLVNSTRTTKGSSQWNINYTRLSSDGAVKWTYEARRKGQYYEDLPPLKSDLRTQLGLQDYIELAGPVVEQADSTLHLYFNRSELLAHNVVIGRCEAVTTDGVAIEGQECPVPDQVASLQANDVAPYLVTRLGPGIAYAREINVEKSSENGPTGWKWDFESDRRAGLTDAVLTPDGGLIGVGYTMPHTTLQLKRTRHDYDAVIFRLAPDGTELWSQEYASPTRDIFARIVALGENRYAVGGHTGVNSTTGEWDPWLLIVDGDGKTQSAVPKK